MSLSRSLRVVRPFASVARWFSSAPAPAPIKVFVNDVEYAVPPNFSVLQACETANVTIPRFCYHDRLSIAGNCRMCLVEVEKTPKPVASCAMPLMPGMRIKTDTPLVKKAREGVMEFLLANHPLDCPICDQGGECDLQDQSLYFGGDRSRFREIKRTVEDKNIGPLVKTVMTRCIHCTRCVRFTTEVCGVTVMGTTGRGNVMEIGTYVDKLLDTELSGNTIDLCPVGALTSKPFAFTARPWELKNTESIDVMDALGSSIRVDSRGPEVLRILPRIHDEVNEEWIGDKTRFSYDGLKRQRLDQPMIRGENGEFAPATWIDVMHLVRDQLKSVSGGEVMGVVGPMVDAESILVFKDLLAALGSANMTTEQGVYLPADLRANYIFNSTVAGIDSADAVLIVGSNPRMECPVLAARLRKLAKNGVKIACVGPEADLAMKHQQLGNSSTILNQIVEGKHPFSSTLRNAKRPLVLVGIGAFKSNSAALASWLQALPATFPNLRNTETNWNGVNILHSHASNVAAHDLGFQPGVNAFAKKAKVVYLVGAESYDTTKTVAKPFIIYQGHHGDAGAAAASVILPSPTYTEKTALYVNTEGRVQRTQAAVGRLVQAREDWSILRALSEVVGKTLPYNNIESVRARLSAIAPTFNVIDRVLPSTISLPVAAAAPLPAFEFQPYLSNYFQTDAISNNSKVMAKCSQQLPTARNSYKQQQKQ